MDDQQNLGEKVVSELKKDFTLVGKSRVHSWYAWAIVGITVGMFIGIVYVANRSGQFSASQADELDGSGVISAEENENLLSFLNEDNEGITTNTILRVRSLEPDGSPSIGWLEFSIAPEGSEGWQPLEVDYNVGIVEPGIRTAVTKIFDQRLDIKWEAQEVDVIDPPANGTYIIRVRRATTDGDGDFTAQAWNRPLMPTPQAFLRVNFSWVGLGQAIAQNTAPFCGCEKIKMDTSGPVSNEFLPWLDKNIFKNPNVPNPPRRRWLEVWEYTKFKELFWGIGKDANYNQLAFEISATLTPGSDPNACTFGQEVQARSQFAFGAGGDQGRNDYFSVIQDPPPMSPGGPASDAMSRRDIMAAGSSVSIAPPGGDLFALDDYSKPSALLKFLYPEPIVIRWLDAPGAVAGFDESYPIHNEHRFKHLVDGTQATGGVWKYTFHRGTPLERSVQYTIPTRAAGKNCLCESHLVIDVDTERKGVYRMTTTCGGDFYGTVDGPIVEPK